ncbi:SDR family NAD(P)-dependent oxidoreductase [Actinoplanes sp. NPDC020271]|uniref:SDR family NAD(P)-dependent oxidoreductase n=1 Tax=Actinoplanes sp. NPDC020271 TaxID=3363896 RepID=UPI0037BAEA1C
MSKVPLPFAAPTVTAKIVDGARWGDPGSGSAPGAGRGVLGSTAAVLFFDWPGQVRLFFDWPGQVRLGRRGRGTSQAVETVVITGASSGVGRAAALAFARAGARLVLSSRSAPALEQVAAECRALRAEAHARAEAATGNAAQAAAQGRAEAGAGVKAGGPAGSRVEGGARAQGENAGGVTVVVADVTAPETVEAVAAAAGDRIDVWVHTAAVMAYGRFEDVPAEVFDQVVATDLLGAATVARVALKRFRRQGPKRGRGVLIFGGSLLGTVVTPYTSSYVTSKWGLRALVRALRLETRDAPAIHVCLVSPGAVDTPIYRNAANFAGRIGRPPPPIDRAEKVAAAIVRCARRPRGTVTVGAANKLILFGFLATPPLYDFLVGPLMRLAGLSREKVAPHPGNVFAPPPPSAESVRGGRRRR